MVELQRRNTPRCDKLIGKISIALSVSCCDMKISNGWAMVSLPLLTLIEISQRLTTLNSKSASDSSHAFARALKRGLSSMNHRKVCVSSRSFIPDTRQNLQAAHQN